MLFYTGESTREERTEIRPTTAMTAEISRKKRPHNETGWGNSFEDNNTNNNSNNMAGRQSVQQGYPQQKSPAPVPHRQSFSSMNCSSTYTSGQQRASNQMITPRASGQSNNNNSSIPANRREYGGLSDNRGTPTYSRMPPAKPNVTHQPVIVPVTNQRRFTFTASNSGGMTNAAASTTMTLTNRNRTSTMDNKMPPRNSAHASSWNSTNNTKTRSPQPFPPKPCRQMLGGESSHVLTDLLEADMAPGFAISPQDGPSMEGTDKKVKVAPGRGGDSMAKKTPPTDDLSPVFSTDIKQLKTLYNKYKNKFNMIFEVYGVLDSAMHPNPALTGKQFILRDQTDRIECIFYEIDRVLPRLTRGHWQRCIGLADKEEGKFMCLSVRPASIEERRAVQALAPILDHHLQTVEQQIK